MNKKRIVTLLVAGALTLGVVGGTYAWFTAKDTVTNSFSTLGSDEDESGDIKIVEEFDEDGAKEVLPGTTVRKEVSVKNVGDYDEFIRVSLNPKFNQDSENKLDTKLIELNLTKDSNWIKGEDGWYYYIGKVAPEETTKKVLDSVTLSKNAENEYKNVSFEVVVIAEGIQAKNGAAADTWQSAGADIIDELTNLE